MTSECTETFNLLPGPMEAGPFGLSQKPVQLFSSYKTNQNWSIDHYKSILEKAKSIFNNNPWLMGSLSKDKKSKSKDNTILVVNKNKLNFDNFIFEEVVESSLFTKDEITYHQKCEILKNFRVENAANILKNDSNLGQIHILRDNRDIESATYIGIILSVNHIVADARTIYNLFGMLDKNSNVRCLDRQAVPYLKLLKEKTNLCAKNGQDSFEACMKARMVPLLVKSWTRQNKPEYQVKMYNFKVNQEEIDRIKSEYNRKTLKFQPQSSLADSTATSTASRGTISTAGNTAHSFCDFISTNDILTSWFFLKNDKADFIQMAVDVRSPRLENLHGDLAGNYLALLYLRKENILSPSSVRRCLNSKLTKTEDRGTHQKVPAYKTFRKYPGGICSNWSTFYKSVELDGLDLEFQAPFLNVLDLDVKMFGIKIGFEDNIVIFKCNDEDTAVFIFTGSNRIKEQDLERDVMLGERII